MSSENLDVLIARMDERLKLLLSDVADSQESRKNIYQRLEANNQNISELSSRMKYIELSFAKAAPTIDEFVTIKHKVIGAGLMGKWIWGALGILIGFIYGIRTELINWLSKS